MLFFLERDEFLGLIVSWAQSPNEGLQFLWENIATGGTVIGGFRSSVAPGAALGLSLMVDQVSIKSSTLPCVLEL